MQYTYNVLVREAQKIAMVATLNVHESGNQPQTMFGQQLSSA